MNSILFKNVLFFLFKVVYTLFESGIVLKLREKTWARMKSEAEPMSSDALYKRPEIDILTLDDLQAPFIMFLFLTMLSLSVAIFDCLAAKKK